MRYLLTIILALAPLAAGCGGPDPLTLQERVQLMVHMNEQLQNEVYQLNRRIAELSPGGTGSTMPQQGPDRLAAAMADDPFRAVKLELHRISGGFDADGQPGDDGVRLLVQPRDAQNDVVKRPGAIEIDLFDLMLDEGSRRLGHWEFTVSQAAKEWVTGLLGATGYSFQLKWPGDKPPVHNRLTVMVRMTTLDGRPLTVQKEFDVTLPGQPAE